MAITQIEVDNFLAAGKEVVVPSMKWTERGDVATWSAPVELDAVNVGTIDTVFQRALSRHWNFRIFLHNEQILRWDFRTKGVPTRHKNKRKGKQCPPDYPMNCESTEQEHRWCDGFGCFCAKPLALSLADLDDHATALAKFCDHVCVELKTPYSPPPVGEQLKMAA